jgi:invasion protein IalB
MFRSILAIALSALIATPGLANQNGTAKTFSGTAPKQTQVVCATQNSKRICTIRTTQGTKQTLTVVKTPMPGQKDTPAVRY